MIDYFAISIIVREINGECSGEDSINIVTVTRIAGGVGRAPAAAEDVFAPGALVPVLKPQPVLVFGKRFLNFFKISLL